MIKRFSRGLYRYLPPGVPLLPLLFILFALPTSLFLALAVPPGEVPDEPAHVARAASLLHGELLGQRRPRLDGAGHPIMGAGILINPGPLFADFGFSLGQTKKMSAANLTRLGAIVWSDHLLFVGAPNTAPYFPIFYVPAAIGLGAGHVLQYSPLVALLIGRVLDALVFVALGGLALTLARRGRLLLFATLCLPMTLWLAGSFNQDGLLIATTCLAAALLTRPVSARGWSYWVAGLMLACVIAVKPPYLPLAVVMLLPCRGWDRRELARGLCGLLLAAVPGVIWEVVTLSCVSTPFVFGPPYLPGPLWPGDPHRLFPGTDVLAQARVFLHDPRLLITLPWETMRLWGNWELKSMVGILGPLDVGLPLWMYYGWYVGLGFAALGDMLASPREGRGPWGVFVVLSLFALVVALFAIYDLEYMSWTTVGKIWVDGVQGRYDLPLLAMLAISLPVIRVTGGRAARAALILPAIAFAAIGMAYLPRLVLTTYYLH